MQSLSKKWKKLHETVSKWLYSGDSHSSRIFRKRNRSSSGLHRATLRVIVNRRPWQNEVPAVQGERYANASRVHPPKCRVLFLIPTASSSSQPFHKRSTVGWKTANHCLTSRTQYSTKSQTLPETTRDRISVWRRTSLGQFSARKVKSSSHVRTLHYWESNRVFNLDDFI